MNSSRTAILLTCHNRKEKTLSCLDSIASLLLPAENKLEIFLVDDGSTDGTAEAVHQAYPDVHILQGNGQLFWAGGMRFAWETALSNGPFDFYWLVNDDTILYPQAYLELLQADQFALEKYGKQGLYTGSTRDPLTKAHSYGGQRLLSEKSYASEPVVPNGTYQKCDFTNANILLVPKAVVDHQGVLSKKYTHSIADYDYSMRAVRSGIPALVLPSYIGECVENLGAGHLESFSLKKRIQHLYSPKGFSYAEFLHFIRTFFPKTYGKTIVTLWLRTLFPALWNRYKSNK